MKFQEVRANTAGAPKVAIIKADGCIFTFWSMLRYLFLIATFYFLTGEAQAQVVQGQVVDSKTQEPLAFVSIGLRQTVQGTTTDINGRFRLRLPDNTCAVEVSYVGYEKLVLSCASVLEEIPLVIVLTQKTTGLQEVVVQARENPAFRIIRLALQNKSRHDPYQLQSFQYNSYNKLVVGGKGLVSDSSSLPVDSTQKTGKGSLPSHFFLSESFTERKFLAPNLTREIVLGNKVSGYKNPIVALVGTDFQPISFYEENITFFDQTYLNPLSQGSFKNYDFVLEDQVLHAQDTTFLISFAPLPDKNFNGLKGVFAINSDAYALEYVTTGPVGDNLLLQFTLRQKYGRVQGHWFPAQLHLEAKFTKFKVASQNVYISSKSELRNVMINPPLRRQDFTHLVTELAPSANQQTAEAWHVFRPDSLNPLEKKTYQLYDSLSRGQAAFLNSYMGVLEGFALDRYKVGKLDVIPSRLFGYNEYEGVRLGLGLQTNESFSDLVQVGGYAGYGLRDKAFKYGANLGLVLSHRAKAIFTLAYQKEVAEPGTQAYFKNSRLLLSDESLRDLLAHRMDSLERWKASFSFRTLKFLQVEASLTKETRNPVYAYQYTPQGEFFPQRNPAFAVLEVGIGLRYAPNERYTQLGRGSTVLRQEYPVLRLYVGKGLQNSSVGANYAYFKTEAKVDHQFIMKGLGSTKVQLSLGYLSGEVPYPYLFTGHGSQSESMNSRLVIPRHFQTMDLYEFLSDRYAHVFLAHNFGQLLFKPKSKYVQPEVLVVQNIGFGSLRGPENHREISFQTMEKGFYESGLLLQNLVRFSYLDMAYLGLGGGAFYRYGSYAWPTAKDNLALKLVTSFTF